MSRRNIPRVGFVSHSPGIGGAERALLNFLQYLPPGIIRPLVIFPKTDRIVRSAIREIPGLPVFEIPYGCSIPIHGQHRQIESEHEQITAFLTLFKELELDCVVVNTTVIYPASAAAALSDIPLVIHSHGILNEVILPTLDPDLWDKIETIQLQLADRLLVPSDWIAHHYRTFVPLTRERLSVVPNGTSLPSLNGTHRSCVPGEIPEFSMLCTLEPNKGVAMVIEAARIVLSQRPRCASFVVYGDGSPTYRAELERMIRCDGLEGSFRLCPKQLEVSSIYEFARAVIVASYIESFSFVAIEAMSYCKPVIATRCGGPEEIVEDGKTGFLVDIGDSAELAQRILRLIDEPELCDKMGRAARMTVEARFDIHSIADDYLSIILSAIGEARSKEWGHRRRLLTSFLMSRDNGPGGKGPSAQTGVPMAITSLNTSLFLHDFRAKLELVRSRLHEVNSDLN